MLNTDNTDQVSDTNKDRTKVKLRNTQRTILIASGILLVGITMFWSLTVKFTWSTHLDSLFSGMAFIGLITTVLLQMEELKLQRQELADTRVALERSAAAQERSEEAFVRQIKAMDYASLINGYSSMVDYYDRNGRSNGAERDQSKHALQRMKEITDNVEMAQGWDPNGQRPSDWRRM